MLNYNKFNWKQKTTLKEFKLLSLYDYDDIINLEPNRSICMGKLSPRLFRNNRVQHGNNKKYIFFHQFVSVLMASFGSTLTDDAASFSTLIATVVEEPATASFSLTSLVVSLSFELRPALLS